MTLTAYRGRFAPTPSGALHFGSLIAALGSYLDARAHHGEWHLRIEDVDPPRIAQGSSDSILRTLEAFGFEWDGPVVYQSQRSETYAATIAKLLNAGLLYGCDCTRKRLKENARIGVDGPVYPGSCRNRSLPLRGALRLRLRNERIVFDDLLAGRVACDVVSECGDFVLRRADGVYTYQLAVTVDDAELGISHIVRGADLLASTPRQIVLQQILGYTTPTYLHLPVVLNADGGKLSKQTLATSLCDKQPLPALCKAAAFLGLALPADIASTTEFWHVAPQHWQRDTLPVMRGKQ